MSSCAGLVAYSVQGPKEVKYHVQYTVYTIE